MGDLVGTSVRRRCASSAYPRMAASGVRSSWLASATNDAPGLTRLARAQGRRDVVEHPVERRTHLSHFGIRVRVAFGNPHRQCDLAAVQRQVGDRRAVAANWVSGAMARRMMMVRAQRRGEHQGRAGDDGPISSTRSMVSSTSASGTPVTTTLPCRS